MGDAAGISAAGMQAASQWFSATAANIVSLTSVSAPASQDPGGAGGAAPGLPSSLLAYDPQAPYANMQGMVAGLNADLATQLVHLHEAANSFRANLLALKVSSRMVDNLLNTVA